jgi:transposase
MLAIAPSTKIFLVTGSTDMRKSYDALSAIVSGTLMADPYSGHVWVFCNRVRNRLKILVWDRCGFLLVAKRLEKGTFAWPESAETTIDMTPEELSLLLGGIDLRGARRRPWYRRPDTNEEKTLVSSRKALDRR